MPRQQPNLQSRPLFFLPHSPQTSLRWPPARTWSSSAAPLVADHQHPLVLRQPDLARGRPLCSADGSGGEGGQAGEAALWWRRPPSPRRVPSPAAAPPLRAPFSPAGAPPQQLHVHRLVATTIASENLDSDAMLKSVEVCRIWVEVGSDFLNTPPPLSFIGILCIWVLTKSSNNTHTHQHSPWHLTNSPMLDEAPQRDSVINLFIPGNFGKPRRVRLTDLPESSS